jgi:hypothetical protein
VSRILFSFVRLPAFNLEYSRIILANVDDVKTIVDPGHCYFVFLGPGAFKVSKKYNFDF